MIHNKTRFRRLARNEVCSIVHRGMTYLPEIAAGTVFIGVGLTAMYGTFVPQSGLWGRNIWRGDSGSNAVALSFDDGPTPQSTPQVLEILNKFNIPAAFFIIGRNAAKNPELLRQIHSQGHLVANHTYDHHHYSVFRGYRYWRDQLQRNDELIEATIGLRPRFFRPPVGIKFVFTALAVRRLGHVMVTWTHRAMDGVDCMENDIHTRLADRARPGNILTLHDGIDPHYNRTPEATLRALPSLIARLQDRGLTFMRLDQLIGERPYHSAPASLTR